MPSEKLQIDLMAIDSKLSSSITTGLFLIAPTPKIEEFGWLIIGRPKTQPKIPKFVTVNVDPDNSEGLI